VGGYYDNSYSGPAEQPAPPGQTIVIYPSAASALPGGNSGPAPGEQSRFRLYQPEPIQAEEDSTQPAEPAQYLLAFKDRTVYSTPAYWVDGDTIHYFSAGNKHNQASVSLIDRALTERLNEESGAEVKLPPEK
jgi:hypothetical protein